jgi:hypothetical protein
MFILSLDENNYESHLCFYDQVKVDEKLVISVRKPKTIVVYINKYAHSIYCFNIDTR